MTPSEGKLTFTIADPVTLVDSVCEYGGVTACQINNVARLVANQTPKSYTIDASDVVPVGIKSLTLAPNPADGSIPEIVTDTVTLNRRAPIDTTIKLFSNDANATLPSPIPPGPVTKGSVTIAKGERSGTFTVNSNANGLEKGDLETAYITAFYTEPTTASLTTSSGKSHSRLNPGNWPQS